MSPYSLFYALFFFFNDTATTEIYTLSLHDALPISLDELWAAPAPGHRFPPCRSSEHEEMATRDRKSTRLNSSHANISYAVFCLKKKKHRRVTPIVTVILSGGCIQR